MAYYIFLKSLRSLEEFRKKPHVKIPPKSPSTIFQSLGKFKNPIFNPEILFLHFRPIRPSGQPAYSASRPTPPPSLCFPRPACRPTPPPGLRFPRPACRRTPPPGLRPIARPSWPTRQVISLLTTQPPLISALSRHDVKPPWLPQPSPRPPLSFAPPRGELPGPGAAGAQALVSAPPCHLSTPASFHGGLSTLGRSTDLSVGK
jgi:hypothetical protein